MSIIAPEHGDSDSSSVRRKSNATGKIRVSDKKSAKKTAGGAPEVMAKVTGFSKGASHAKSNIDYISRNGEVELENERGDVLKGREEIKEYAKEWVKDFGDGKRWKDQRDTMHLIMSMPEGTAPEAVKQATREFAREVFGKNHEYVFALHTDTSNPHTHITIKTLGHNGARLNPRKDDLQNYREKFAAAMERQGYMANATPRPTRGVVKKATRQAIKHMNERDASKVTAKKVKEAVADLKAESNPAAPGAKVESQPWLPKIHATQQQVKRAWLAVAKALETTDLRNKENVRPDYGRLHGRRVSDVRHLAARLGERGELTGVHQSGYRASGGRGPSESVSSMRNVSSVPMVQHTVTTSMLLHANALDSLENGHGRGNGRKGEGRTSDDLRRSGTGAVSDVGRTGEGEREAAASPAAQGAKGTGREGQGIQEGAGHPGAGIQEATEGRGTRSAEIGTGAGKSGQGVKPPQATRLNDTELAALIKDFVEHIPPVATERDAIKQQLVAKFTKPGREQATKVPTPAAHPAPAPSVQPVAPQVSPAAPDKELDR